MKLTEYIAITLNEKTCLSVCRRRQCPTERGDLLSKVARKHRLGLCSTNKKEQILAECQAKINGHECQAACDRRSLLNWVKLLNLNKKNFIALELKKFNNEMNSFFKDSFAPKIWNYVKLTRKVSFEMEELKKFQSSTFDTIARRRSVEDQDTILELSGRIQELQNELNCMSDSREFQDAESIRSGNSHVPEGMLRRSLGVPSRREGPPSIWDTHGISGNVFQIQMRHHQHLILKN